MKKLEIDKKLLLNKTTISNLEQVRAGDGIIELCDTHPTSCHTSKACGSAPATKFGD